VTVVRCKQGRLEFVDEKEENWLHDCVLQPMLFKFHEKKRVCYPCFGDLINADMDS